MVTFVKSRQHHDPHHDPSISSWEMNKNVCEDTRTDTVINIQANTHAHAHTHTYTHQGIPAHICVMTTHTKKYRKHTNTHSCHHTKEYELHTTHTCYHSTQNTTTYLKSFIAHWQARLYTICTKYQGMPLRLIHCSSTLVGLSLHLQDICFPRVAMDTIQDTIANVTMPTVQN